MSDVTRILQTIEHGDTKASAKAAEELISIVYEELRRIARHRMARERPDHTLQPTELADEAWMRLLGPDGRVHFQNRAHFFGAAAGAMRRILVDRARRHETRKEAGYDIREELDESAIVLAAPEAELLAIHECLDQLAVEEPVAARLVNLRYFLGMTMEDAAEMMGLPKSTAEKLWTFAKAWLRRRIEE